MSIINIPFVPSAGEETCFEGQTSNYEIIGGAGATDVATILADIITAQAPTISDPKGVKADVAVTADMVVEFAIRPLACGNVDSAGSEITADFVYLDGNTNTMSGGYTDVPGGGIDTARAIEVPAGGAALVNVCWKQCYNKVDYAALT